MAEEGLRVLAALGLEARALRRALGGALVIRIGVGPGRARRHTAQLARTSPRCRFAVAGLAGALDPALAPGAIVVASEVRTLAGERWPLAGAPALARALADRGVRPCVGPMLAVARPVFGRRRARLRETGAVAVEMESGAAAAVLGPRLLAVLRVIVDGPDAELWSPRLALRGWRALRTLERAAPALRVLFDRTTGERGPQRGTGSLERGQVTEQASPCVGAGGAGASATPHAKAWPREDAS